MGLGKHLSIVRQFDKTTNLSQNNKFIPHAIVRLDLRSPIAYYCKRPLAQFLASKVLFPGKPDIMKNYSNMDFGKEFTSEQLSKTISKTISSTMRPVVGWNFTISSWRHINIAKRKFCKGLADISEQTSGHAIHALQSVANEKRVYGLSPEALLGAPEDVMYLFLDASIEWQVVNKVTKSLVGHVAYRACYMT
ncbi:hypothetical protein JOM56_012774 [Amanita muscaria]